MPGVADSEAGVASAVAGFALFSLFGFAMSWVGALTGMLARSPQPAARSPQAADGLSMLPAFVLGFVSNVFVPTAGLPAWLRVIAEWNPLCAVVTAARQLFGTPQGGTAGTWTLQHPVVTTVAMGVVLLAVLVPVTVRRYVRRG